MLTNCSSRDDEKAETTDDYFPVKVTRTGRFGDAQTQEYHYKEVNKLDYIIEPNGWKTVFTYSGNFITKIETFSIEGYSRTKNDYEYKNNKISKATYSNSMDDSYSEKYIWKNDNEVLIENEDYSQNVEKSQLFLFFENDNLVKTEKYLIANNGTDNFKTTTIFENDNVNNPFKNIVGYRYLTFFHPIIFGQKNNMIKRTITTEGIINGIPVSGTGDNFYSVETNDNKYPSSYKILTVDNIRYQFEYNK